MTRKRYTEEQIIAVLKDAQAGIGVSELCRKHSISDATFYKWRTKYAGLEVSDVKTGQVLGSGLVIIHAASVRPVQLRQPRTDLSLVAREAPALRSELWRSGASFVSRD